MEKERLRFRHDDGRINWKGLFKMDVVHFLFFISVLLMAWGYSHDTTECRDMLENLDGICKSRCEHYPVELDDDFGIPTYKLDLPDLNATG